MTRAASQEQAVARRSADDREWTRQHLLDVDDLTGDEIDGEDEVRIMKLVPEAES